MAPEIPYIMKASQSPNNCDANRPISQMRATLAAWRKLALDYNTYP